jgi:EAL domain-containing protein (putative c-di-GMP-specific phosphodiesterase class I)
MGEDAKAKSAPGSRVPLSKNSGIIDKSEPPVESNWLSGAPSAAGVLTTGEAQFFEALVAPWDLYAVFQPIVSLETGKLFAHEALVRCRLPEFTPTTLFKRAAELRSVGRLGRMIREIAIPLCGGMPIFVNIHPAELDEHWLVQPDDPICSHDQAIYLEITESAPLTHPERCMRVLREVCARSGAQLVVDDLGAGYSNLKLIADLEPKVVKLDRLLVQDLHRHPRQHKLVSMIVRLCDGLGASVVAEGIETVEELRAACDAGVQYGQGFLLARPAYPPPTHVWPSESGEEPMTRRSG